jgi:hypothetical protein
MASATNVGVRWTIGDVSPQGFEALRLSVLGARKVFGPRASYAICVNSVPLAAAQDRTGELPSDIQWIDSTDLWPDWIRPHLDPGMAEGVAWKFAPLRVFASRYEIALDNDCILWELPRALRVALEATPQKCVLAEDVRPYFGQFAQICGPEPRNTGIRGIPPGFDLEGSLRTTLDRCGFLLRTESDEQGFQVAALSAGGAPALVSTEEVSICSPFPPHSRALGRCGAHFVGLNARNLPWSYYDRPASEVRREHWYELYDDVLERVVPLRAVSADLS